MIGSCVFECLMNLQFLHSLFWAPIIDKLKVKNNLVPDDLHARWYYSKL